MKRIPLYSLEALRHEINKWISESPPAEEKQFWGETFEFFVDCLNLADWRPDSSLWEFIPNDGVIKEYFWNPYGGTTYEGPEGAWEIFEYGLQDGQDVWTIVEALKNGTYANQDPLICAVYEGSRTTLLAVEDVVFNSYTPTKITQRDFCEFTAKVLNNSHTDNEIKNGAWKAFVRPDTDLSAGRNANGG